MFERRSGFLDGFYDGFITVDLRIQQLFCLEQQMSLDNAVRILAVDQDVVLTLGTGQPGARDGGAARSWSLFPRGNIETMIDPRWPVGSVHFVGSVWFSLTLTQCGLKAMAQSQHYHGLEDNMD